MCHLKIKTLIKNYQTKNYESESIKLGIHVVNSGSTEDNNNIIFYSNNKLINSMY